jgi:hypothetical protein
MTFALDSLFDGLWDMIWKEGLGIGLIICFLLAAWFSPVFKKDFFYAAVITGVLLVVFNFGIKSESKHTVAQEKVVNTTVDNAVKRSKTPAVRRAKDPWDNPKY